MKRRDLDTCHNNLSPENSKNLINILKKHLTINN